MPKLSVSTAGLSSVESPDSGATWKLCLDGGSEPGYRLAQLDDYRAVPRKQMKWHAPLKLRVRAKISRADLPGTWGFGFWNDPFSAGFGHQGAARRLPVLPDALWFFYASPQNYLSLRDDLPARGMLAAAFSSTRFPAPFLALGIPLLPLLFLPPLARYLRKVLRNFVREDSAQLAHVPDDWHTYELAWMRNKAVFFIDGRVVFETAVVPAGPLGFVLWLDNQYASFTPDGRLAFGLLDRSECACLEISELSIETSGET